MESLAEPAELPQSSLLCLWFASLARLSKERGREQEGSVDDISLNALESGAVPVPEFSGIPGSGRNISFQASVSLVLSPILGLLQVDQEETAKLFRCLLRSE